MKWACLERISCESRRMLLVVAATLLLGSLYESDPYIVRVDDMSLIHGSTDVTHAVEFFAGWCGHCQAFSPTWKAVAASTCAASAALKIGVVDCVAHDAICQEMQVGSFPTIRLFTPGGPRLGKRLPNCEHGCSSAAATLDDILRFGVALHAWAGRRSSNAPPTTASALTQMSRLHPCSTAARLLPPPPPAASAMAMAGGAQIGVGVPPPELALQPLPLGDAASAVLYSFRFELFRKPVAVGSARQVALLRQLAYSRATH